MRWNKRKNIFLYQNENGKLLKEAFKLENELITVKREKRLDDLYNLIELDKILVRNYWKYK